MVEYINRLYEEILKVQVCDDYYPNGDLRTEEFYFNNKFLADTNKLANLVKHYETNNKDDDSEYFEEDDYYDINEVLEGLVYYLRVYEYIYILKGISISNDEWDTLFDTLANYYSEKDYTDCFITDMVNLNKYAVARALVYDKDLDLETYIESLKYLESNYLPMDSIIEIINILEKEFNKEFTHLIKNEDGSYGCLNKNAKIIFLKDSNDIDKVKDVLESNGLEINKTLDVCAADKTPPQKIKHKGEKTIDFNANKETEDK